MITDEEIIRTAADELPAGVWIARAPGGELVYANHAFRQIMGVDARSDVGVGGYAEPYGIHRPSGERYPESELPFVRALATKANVIVDDIVIHRPDGRRVFVRAEARPVRVPSTNAISHVVIAFVAITREAELERARHDAETRLVRAQRMESVGNLAGGVAHDFNNLLAVVRLLSDSLRRGEHDPRRLEDLHRIDEVVDSAAQLTRSLLGFAGQGKNRSERVAIDTIATSLVDIVARALDRRIEVRAELRARADVVGDASQLEQVLMNLVVNARDAVPETGRVVLRTYVRDVEAADVTRLGRLEPGPHVVLEVEDDGTGIDPAVRDRIFEPYFTTKTSGHVRGSGLGLATVYGIVEGHRGAIEVVDVLPRGTLVRVLLPRAPEGAPHKPTLESTTAANVGSATILVVEDEPLVRHAARRAIGSLGYDVIVAADGVEALEIFRERAREIDAVVLDMIMPRLGGRGTYVAMREIDPEVAVVLTTGYTLSQDAQAIIDLGVHELLEKPYRVETLAVVLGRLVALRRGRAPLP